MLDQSLQNSDPNRHAYDTSETEKQFRLEGLTDVQELDSNILVKLAYADTNNFMNKDFYGGMRKAFFPCEVAIRICNAQKLLKNINPDYTLLIFDAARPLHVQKMMWDSLDMEPDKKFKYLAPPFTISLHNFGCAADVTVYDTKENKELDMGTAFDDFSKLSEPVFESQFLKKGELSMEQVDNRKLLRKVMMQAGLNPINSEWWHFNYCTKEFAASHFKLLK